MQPHCDKLAALVASSESVTFPLYALPSGVVLAGQPEPQDWHALAEHGIQTVVNFRSDPTRARVEAANVEAAGLRYLFLPLPAYELEASHLALFHDLIQQAGSDGLFLHCRSASRVALLWLLHRVVYDGWSEAEAEVELAAAGYDEEAREVFQFCAADYFERAVPAQE